MRKRISISILVLFTISLFVLPYASAEQPQRRQQAAFNLPLSLLKIEDDAFSNTAAENIIFPEDLLCIGENAFSGANNLTDVFIPECTEYIAESAFPKAPSIVIHGVKGSYAESWAKKHGVPFVDANTRIFISDNGKTVRIHDPWIDFLYRKANPQRIEKANPQAEDENASKRPQDRPELNPIDYKFP